jgi:phage terminase small subunit
MLLFASNYVANKFNATQAAKDAGYSEKTSYSQGQRLLKNVEVQVEISRKIKEILKDIDYATYKIISELDDIIYSDIGDFARIETVQVQEPYTDDEGVEHPGKEAQKVIFTETKKLNTRVLSEIAEGQHGIKIKMQDKLKAIELKGRYLKMWSDGVIAAQGDTTDKPELSAEERRKKIIELTNKL